MKTRIIHTKLWKDTKVQELSISAQHLFIYLLTSEHIGMTGIFELPDVYMKLEAKLTDSMLKDAKKQLTDMEMVMFWDGWVYVKNADKHNNYGKSPKNQSAYKRELDNVPEKIKLLFKIDTTMDSTMGGSMDTTPIVTINHKSKIINNKSETINHKSETGEGEKGFSLLRKKLAEEKSFS